MEVRQLQIFRTLSEELSFTRTAEKVHTVQSNVTAQIKALEEELGMPLFDRLGRRVTLTDAGRNFLPFALQALAAMDHGQRAIQSGAEPSGPLRIGAAESLLTYRLPEVLRAFRRHFPHVELIFRPYSNATIALELEAGRFDMVIHGDACSPPRAIRRRAAALSPFAELHARPALEPTDDPSASPTDPCGWRRSWTTVRPERELVSANRLGRWVEVIGRPGPPEVHNNHLGSSR